MGEAEEQYAFYSLAQEVLPEYGCDQISFCHFATGVQERIAYLRLRVQEGDCFAFGAGAVGNLGSFVFFNFPMLDAYMEMVKEGEFPAMVAGDFTPHFQFLWELTGQIQHMRVEKEYFKKRYGMNLDETYGEILKRLQEDGLIENTKETFTVTPLGLFWVYNICTLFQ
jgi:oxygen-independent coproporphyrinogen-3 oxidase